MLNLIPLKPFLLVYFDGVVLQVLLALVTGKQSTSFKYYISKLGIKTCVDLAGTGGGVQNLGKPADVILERSIMSHIKLSNEIDFTVLICHIRCFKKVDSATTSVGISSDTILFCVQGQLALARPF